MSIDKYTYLFHYRAIVISVYDGDTITVDWDLGAGIWKRGEKIRLFGINAPEVRGEEREAGIVSRDFLRDLIDGREIIMETIEDNRGKYGRYLAKIYLDGADVNALMVKKGHAVWKGY